MMSRIRLRAGALASACGAALALLSGGGALNAQDESGADVIYTGGPIITIDDARPRAEAVAVDDEDVRDDLGLGAKAHLASSAI